MKPLLLALRYFKLPFQLNHLSSCHNFTDNPKFGNGRASIRFKERRQKLCLSIYAYIYIIFFRIAFLPVLYVIYMYTSFHVCIYMYLYMYIYILIYMYIYSLYIYSLLAQSVRASERNSVVMGSNPTQANFLQLLLKILQW